MDTGKIKKRLNLCAKNYVSVNMLRISALSRTVLLSDASETAHVESIQFSLLSGVRSP